MIYKEISPNDIIMMARGFMASKIILSAAKLNIFDKLPGNIKNIAETEGWDIKSLIILMDGLCAIDILEKSGETYKIRKNLKKSLSRDMDLSILPVIEHFDFLWDNWSDLPKFVKSGRDKSSHITPLADPKNIPPFIGAMHAIGKQMANDLVDKLNPVWATNLLDVGAASGTYTIAFLKKIKKLKATMFDLPDVIDLAKKRIKKEGLCSRVNFTPGDFYTTNFQKGHDLVWASAIIHQNSRDQNIEFFKKCYNALLPKGKIWLRDHIMDKARTAPKGGAIFAINMLVSTPSGSTYTFDEVASDLISAGFKNPKMINYGENMDCIIQAEKI
jgi:predicted nicotinamide N-methyase